MADRYLRPGESALAPADGTPVSGEELEKQADEFFDVDQELSAGLMDSTERDMRRQLKFKGGMLLQDDDGSVFDAGAIFEDSKGETHSLEVGDPLPGYEGYLVSEIRQGRKGGVEVELLGRRGEPVIFGTGPTSGGRGFGEARAKREAIKKARKLGLAISGITAAAAAGMGMAGPVYLPWGHQGDGEDKQMDDFARGTEVDLGAFPPGTLLGTRKPKDGAEYDMYSTDDPGKIFVHYEDGDAEYFEAGEGTSEDYVSPPALDSMNELLKMAESEQSYIVRMLSNAETLGLTSSFEPDDL